MWNIWQELVIFNLHETAVLMALTHHNFISSWQPLTWPPLPPYLPNRICHRLTACIVCYVNTSQLKHIYLHDMQINPSFHKLFCLFYIICHNEITRCQTQKYTINYCKKYKCVKLINSLGFKLPCMSGRPLLIWGQAWCGFSSSLFCYILCSFFPSRLPPFLFLAFADWRSVNREVPIRIGTTKVGNNVSLSEDSLTIPKILWMA